MSNKKFSTCSRACSSISFCSEMSEGEWSRVATDVHASEIPKGAVATLENTAWATFMVVCTGTIGLQHHLSDGRRSLSELFMRGDVVDCRRQSRTFQGDIVALNDAKMCSFRGNAFEEVCRANRGVNLAYNARIREQAHILRDHCVDIGKKTPPERIASFLFEQRNRSSRSARERRTFRIEIPRAAVADYLALQPETVSRSLSRLSREGLISVGQGDKITIINEAQLRRIANGGMPRRGKGAKTITKLSA